MNTLKAWVAIAAIAVTLPAAARVSPHETVSQVIDGCRVTVTYGRPFTKDPKSGEPRKIWGGLVPFGKVWRTGADEATILITQKTLHFGDATVPAGAYSLWTLPAENGPAKLIINKQIGQWGAGRDIYDEKNDVARVDLTKTDLDASTDQFTITVGKSAGGGTLTLSWEKTQYSAPFTVEK